MKVISYRSLASSKSFKTREYTSASLVPERVLGKSKAGLLSISLRRDTNFFCSALAAVLVPLNLVLVFSLFIASTLF